ncbi:MAG: nucleoside recognition domain-containing protein [Desulfomonile tiedjei]|uniref:Nucleoside recognition domain-containing protein n=1 Tax=Desulfomonile tiedjei TaxID=2358 RepID=A0A9D6V3C1_9BACT|nr:nucleoside recognition domain-containing protein [Desulfomonile tiedjei]
MKGEKAGRRWFIVPAILLPLAAVGLAWAIVQSDGSVSSAAKIYSKLLIPLAKLLVLLGLGLLAGQALESLGWTRKLSRAVRPLTRWGHLNDESGAAFVSSFVSGVVANSMLMGFYQEKKISRKELVLTYLLNNGLPVYLVHLPTTFFVVASLAGRAGLIYLAITFVASCLRSLGVLVYTRQALPPPAPMWSALVDHLDPNGESAWARVWKRFSDRFTRLVLYTIPIYVLVFLAGEWGLFQWLKGRAVGWVSYDLFPIEVAGLVIVALAAEFSSGMAAAGALQDAGSLDVKQTVVALIVGTIISTPLRAVRHQLPAYAGLFNLRLGSELLFMSQATRIISLILVTAPYALWG